MDWLADYKKKLCSAHEAMTHVRSGDRVVFGVGSGEAVDLLEALVARADQLRDVEIVHGVALGPGEYCKPEYAESFYHNSLFTSTAMRQAVNDGRADYTPAHFHLIPRLFLEGYLPPDVVLAHLSPPDKHGYCSFGVSVDHVKPAASVSKMIIAQVNPNMPRTHGDAFIHISQLDYIVETEHPIFELPPPKIGPVEEAIGRNIASLIEDGACLQLGIGAIPDAVVLFLHQKNDLGIHTEMFSDGVVDLYNEGVVTNARKNLHRHKLVATFLMGTRKLYDFVDDNPAVNMFPVSYTNNPSVISQIDNVVAINSALQVDVLGQAVAETVGPRHYSGVGGQVDFVRGASESKGGKAIIALPSTAKSGTVSRITAQLAAGAAVTTTRADVDYVVTEHGIAHLKGKTSSERVHLLLEIADPKFRDQIVEDCRALRGDGPFCGFQARRRAKAITGVAE